MTDQGSAPDAQPQAPTNVGAGNWRGVGMWAWIFHRVSGLVLLGYLFVHIWVVSRAQSGEEAFDRLFHSLESPVFVILDLLLVWAVLYHAWNGLRVLLMDLNLGVSRHKATLFGLMLAAVATLALFVVVSVDFLAR